MWEITLPYLCVCVTKLFVCLRNWVFEQSSGWGNVERTFVSLVVVALLIQPLIGSQPGISWKQWRVCIVFCWVIESTCKLRHAKSSCFGDFSWLLQWPEYPVFAISIKELWFTWAMSTSLRVWRVRFNHASQRTCNWTTLHRGHAMYCSVTRVSIIRCSAK